MNSIAIPFSAMYSGYQQTRALRELIELGETDQVEFKRRFSNFTKIAKEMIAFANTRGGRILIGVDDDGSITGVDSEKHEIELVTTAGEFYCDPPVRFEIDVVEIDHEDVVVVTIPESRTKPHYLVRRLPSASRRGPVGERRNVPEVDANAERQAYIRQADRSILASREVERVLASDRPDAPPLRLHIGRIEQALFDYLGSNRRITLREYRHLVNISERRASRILVRLVRAGLIRIFTEESEDYYTLA